MTKIHISFCRLRARCRAFRRFGGGCGFTDSGFTRAGVLLVLGIMTLLPFASHAATYYVATTGSDSNPGTQSRPFRTVQKAANSVAPGDTVLIRAGTYNSSSSFRVSRAGTSSQRITYKAYGDGPVRISRAQVMPGPWTLHKNKIYKTTYSQAIMALFRGSAPLEGSGRYVTSIDTMMPNSFFVSGSTVYVWLADGSDPDNSLMRASPGHVVELYDCHYNTFDGLTVEYGFNGFKKQGSSTHHVTIRNCTIRSIASQGVQPVAASGIIERNLFQKIGTSKYQHGIYCGISGIVIRHNIFEEIEGAGVHLYNANAGFEKCEVYGNIFRKPRPMTATGGYYVDVVAWGTGRHKIYNNLFFGEGKRDGISVNSSENEIHHNTFAGSPECIQLYANKLGNRIYNNLCVDAGSRFIVAPSGSGTQTIDYNLYYNFTATPRWQWNGQTYTSFSSYKAASGETHGTYANPRLADYANDDLHLAAGSPAIDSGTGQAGVSVDFDGRARPQGAGYDRGAFEYAGASVPTPAAPSALVASAASSSRITLGWRDNSSDETGFKIDRRQSGTSDWVRIATTGPNATAHTDTGLSADTKFYYRVKAYNAAGNSPYSNLADATTAPEATPPAAPASLAARATGATRIELNWADRSGDETGFKIDRRQSGAGDWVRIATTGPNTTAHTDTGLSADTKFYYMVKAYNVAGNSPYSNLADATTLDAVPHEAVWRYRKGTAEASSPPNAWRNAGFNDSGWAQGLTPIGYTDSGLPLGTELADMRGRYTCVFLRRAFTVAEPAAVSELRLSADYDDGFVLWINGSEVGRVNVAGEPGTAVPYDAVAAGNLNSTWTATLTGARMPALRPGANVIAVQLLNRSLSESGDCLFDMELSVVGSPLSVATDADRNGLPDAWEADRLPDRSDPDGETGSADPDGDGVSNLAEFIAGTDPADEGDTFAVRVELQNGRIVVSFPTVPATGTGYDGCTRHYALEFCTPADTANWLPVPGYTEIMGGGQTVRYTPPAGEPRLYRARVWLELP
ncbi:MAG: fibronectin type III domain-containing protein [Kiritimatiellae bacterium]|nr:fibronectin type III domain-containing protein [Kiritimatiellia bacterium]